MGFDPVQVLELAQARADVLAGQAREGGVLVASARSESDARRVRVKSASVSALTMASFMGVSLFAGVDDLGAVDATTDRTLVADGFGFGNRNAPPLSVWTVGVIRFRRVGMPCGFYDRRFIAPANNPEVARVKALLGFFDRLTAIGEDGRVLFAREAAEELSSQVFERAMAEHVGHHAMRAGIGHDPEPIASVDSHDVTFFAHLTAASAVRWTWYSRS